MFPYLRLSLLIIILIAPAACKEVAYVYGEGGGRVLQDMNLTVHNGSDAVAYTVSLSEGSGSQPKIKRTSADIIKGDIGKKVNQLNTPVIKEGRKLTGNLSGDRRMDQICSIYEYLVSNWVYNADWKGQEYFQYSNESLEYGQDVGKGGKGDCDDFSILLAALIESVGGTPRIIFAYGPQGGHAYAQVYIGQDIGYDSKVSRMIEWLKSEYGVKEVYTVKDDAYDDVWLNLDWWKDPMTSKDVVKHPGGPLFNANDFVLAYSDNNRNNWTSLTPVPEPPLAKFSILKDNPNAMENVTFDASESRDPDTEIKAWNWDFGDGKKGSGETAIHSYSQGGTYIVTLTVTDNDDKEESSQYTQTIEVNGLPIPVIDYEPKEPQLKDAIDFNASQSYDPDPGGSIKKYYWEFGDGEKSIRKHPSPYKYESNGSYNVSLTVEDDKGATNTTFVIIKVNLPPVALMRIEPPQPPNQLHNTGDEVKFDASESMDSDGSIKKWQWDFGDGANSSGTQVSHIYSAWGEFPVVLNVTDDSNASHKIELPLKVNARPIANFTFNPPDTEEGVEITFDASSSKDPDGKVDYYWWDLDETKTEGNKACYPDHIYKKPGEYNITLTVRDNLGATNSCTKNIKVHPPNIEELLRDGQVLVNEHEYEDAIIKFDAILQQDLSHEMAWFYKGYCLNKLGRYDDALESLNSSLASNPENIYTWNEKANALANLGRYQEALYSSNKSIELNPNMWFVWNDRGLILYDMKELEKAADAYDKALSLNPSESDKKDILILKANALSQIPKPAGQSGTVRVANLGIAEFTWNCSNFDGFYYDLDDNIGSEQITFSLSNIDSDKKKATLGDKTDEKGKMGVEYITKAQPKNFKFRPWGQYEVMGFLGEKYFTAYDITVTQSMKAADETVPYLYDKSTDKSLIIKKQISRVYKDDNTELTVTSFTPLKLEEGYELAIKSIDIDGNKVYLELSKDGSIVDGKVISPSKDNPTMTDKTYFYRRNIGRAKDLVIIAVHFKNAFRGADQNLATVDGIWQISDAPAEVEVDTVYDKMTIAGVTAETIMMDNKDNAITLSRNKYITLMGDVKIITSDQDIVDDASPLRYCIYKEATEPGTYEVRGQVATGNFEWTAQNFAGFYYSIDDELGTEKIVTTITQGNKLQEPNGIAYTTTVQKNNFDFKDWGFYNVIGFLGNKCFAGYINNEDLDDADEIPFKESTDKNSLSDKQLEAILMDNSDEMTVTSGTPLVLEEGYELAIKSIDIDGNKVYLELAKDGSVVDSKVISPSRDNPTMADKTYYYKKDVGDSKNLVIIAAHFKNAFRGADQNLATVDGIWQISDAPAEVKVDTVYDKMTIASVSADTITMDNKDNPVILSKNKDITLMGDIKIKTAEADELRYYVYKEFTI